MTAPRLVLVRGDAARVPLADESVDLIVTSPPYWSLRAYTDGGEAYDGQIGAEATPAEFIDNLIDCTREWVRVLKPTGSLWVNLGDKYASGDGSGNQNGLAGGEPATRRRGHNRGARRFGVQTKSLLGLPWRYALRCIDDLGLILRAEVIWSKPNGLPESVTDRTRRSHEQWFHLVKQPRYYSAIDHIRQPHNPASIAHHNRYREANRTYAVKPNTDRVDKGAGYFKENPLGALPGSVWEVATQPLKVPKYYVVQGGRTVHYVHSLQEAWTWMRSRGTAAGRPSARKMADHFAAFPMEWPRRIILGWSPSGICTACGEGRRPVADRTRRNTRPLLTDAAHFVAHNGDERRAYSRGETDVTITGEVCGCPDTTAPTQPALILDPFGGTGTTALVAHALGRDAVSVDMSADYCRLAQWRTTDPKQLAKAVAAKPAKARKPSTGVRAVAGPSVADSAQPPLDGQLDLLAACGGGA